MRIWILLLLSVHSGGCATSAALRCARDSMEVVVLPEPPQGAAELIAEIRMAYPKSLDQRRDHWVWLRSPDSSLYLCTYQRAPILTDKCGANVHIFTPAGDGRYRYTGAIISACH